MGDSIPRQAAGFETLLSLHSLAGAAPFVGSTMSMQAWPLSSLSLVFGNETVVSLHSFDWESADYPVFSRVLGHGQPFVGLFNELHGIVNFQAVGNTAA